MKKWRRLPLALKHNLAENWRSVPDRAVPATRNHVPVLAIAAHIPSSEIGSGYFQETHPQELFRECSHYCELVSSPEQIPQVLAIAMRKAVLNRGVSVVVLPGDVALKPAPEGATTHWYHAPQPVVTPEEEELRKLAQLLCGGA